jgi:hypothetical protein
MPKLYRTLRRKTFPPLGQSLELKVKIKGEKEGGIQFNWFYQEIGVHSINLPENSDRLNGRFSKQEVSQLNWFYRKMGIHSIDLTRDMDRFYCFFARNHQLIQLVKKVRKDELNLLL